MAVEKPTMKMPELMVFARVFAASFLTAETFRVAFLVTTKLANELSEVPLWIKVFGAIAGLAICLGYAFQRDAHLAFARVACSLRIDLLVASGFGVWSNELVLPWLTSFHSAVEKSNSSWALVVLMLLCVVLLSPLIQQCLSGSKAQTSQLHFITDQEIAAEEDDLLASDAQAKSFAETVLASGAHAGLVFGVDAPWGSGKTSFINLAQRYWESASDRVIVCRFEPLRYASEPDLTDRLIRDLSAAIQGKVFAPEFRPAASRYSRLIKGKADISFLGFKLSLEPSQETVDELLGDIDEVLRRIHRRVIIVIDDLDRLDAKTMNNVLFATRRTFKLSQATYVLCYDTEVLVSSKDEESRAREFLEKFVTVKLSLFVDSSSLRDFLRRNWGHADSRLGSVPSDTMVKLGAVLNELADILDGDLAANYLPLVGDLRKVKRFINAILIMQIEKTNFGRTDFNKRDLINLILVHLNYPGLFRRIYAEETEGRSGTFSVRRELDGKFRFKNSGEFQKLLGECQGTAHFLLTQLFDVEVLGFGGGDQVEEAVLRSRACFNFETNRNLQSYLKLIVRFTTPEPQETFVLYQDAVSRVKEGESINSVLASTDFDLEKGESPHDQFWSLLVNQSYSFNDMVAQKAIETLVEYLPRYSSLDDEAQGLRQRSIYSLLRLLDRAGWGRTSGKRLPNSAENVLEIAWRIFGERAYQGKGLLDQLVGAGRGVLGWSDLMLFRLQCSADRGGQLHNLHTALIVDQDLTASTTGLTSRLALRGMRKLSQEVFALFKRTYIEPRRNFLAEVNELPAGAFLGVALSGKSGAEIDRRISVARFVVKSFVVYQLSNPLPPNGSGVGCGYYDESGGNDSGGIAKLMNDYLFGICFNPEISVSNVFLFLDHCLSHFSSGFLAGGDDGGFVATKADIPGGLDPKEVGSYWRKHREQIMARELHKSDRCVFTSRYTAFYRDDLNELFVVLDELADVSLGPDPALDD